MYPETCGNWVRLYRTFLGCNGTHTFSLLSKSSCMTWVSPSCPNCVWWFLSGFLSSFSNIGPHLGCRKTLHGSSVTTFFCWGSEGGEGQKGWRRKSRGRRWEEILLFNAKTAQYCDFDPVAGWQGELPITGFLIFGYRATDLQVLHQLN